MKIAIYSISKNEKENVERWCQSCQKADYKIVLDTGSTDNTPELLRSYGCIVNQKLITPWRFDVARNESLDMVPSDVDICISLDMDEVLCDNWRDILDNVWSKETTMIRYPFFCKPRSAFGFKVHSRTDYYWKYAIHEVLVCKSNKHSEKWIDEYLIFHLPDKTSGSYLKSLIYWNEQEPEEPRYQFYLAREYFDNRDYSKAIEYLIRYQTNSNVKDNLEEAFSYRMLTWCHQYLNNDYNDILKCLFSGLGKHPSSGELWGHVAEIMFTIKDYENAFSSSANALKMLTPKTTYFMIDGWEQTLYHICVESGKRLGISEQNLYTMMNRQK